MYYSNLLVNSMEETNEKAQEEVPEEKHTNWLDAMCELEATPKSIRKITVVKFCKKWGVHEATYYYQARKKENHEKILEIALNSAKKEVPEVLKVLIDNAKAGKERSIEMYLDYIIKLSKNLDIKTDGKPIISIDQAIAAKYDFNKSTKRDSD